MVRDKELKLEDGEASHNNKTCRRASANRAGAFMKQQGTTVACERCEIYERKVFSSWLRNCILQNLPSSLRLELATWYKWGRVVAV